MIIDCIEFNERFRFADPVADMAFLVMDLALPRPARPGPGFADAYFRAAGDKEGRALLPLLHCLPGGGPGARSKGWSWPRPRFRTADARPR